VTTVTIPYAFLTSNDANWQNSPSFSLVAGTYIVSAVINTTPGSSSTATYQYIVYALTTAASNNGIKYILKNDQTQRTTEVYGTGNTYNNRYFTYIVTIPSTEPTLYFSAAFVYTTGGSNNQPQILASPITFTRIA